MSIELNHTIVHTTNKKKSAHFLTELFDLPAPAVFGHFLVVKTANNVSLDFIETTEKFDRQHYAFLISEADFDRIFAKIQSRKIGHWADPGKSLPEQTYTHNGGRGVYFEDPDGHFLEILTRPYVD